MPANCSDLSFHSPPSSITTFSHSSHQESGRGFPGSSAELKPTGMPVNRLLAICWQTKVAGCLPWVRHSTTCSSNIIHHTVTCEKVVSSRSIFYRCLYAVIMYHSLEGEIIQQARVVVLLSRYQEFPHQVSQKSEPGKSDIVKWIDLNYLSKNRVSLACGKPGGWLKPGNCFWLPSKATPQVH